MTVQRLIGEACRVFGILKPHGQPFAVDFPRLQADQLEKIERFLVLAHDMNGYFTYSHVVHKRATISKAEAKRRIDQIRAKVAGMDMRAARVILRTQRGERFG